MFVHRVYIIIFFSFHFKTLFLWHCFFFLLRISPIAHKLLRFKRTKWNGSARYFCFHLTWISLALTLIQSLEHPDNAFMLYTNKYGVLTELCIQNRQSNHGLAKLKEQMNERTNHLNFVLVLYFVSSRRVRFPFAFLSFKSHCSQWMFLKDRNRTKMNIKI